MKINWKDHIVSTPDVIRGKPRIKGTRIPVSLILGYFAEGNTAEVIMEEFPDINKDHIAACLKIRDNTEIYGYQEIQPKKRKSAADDSRRYHAFR